MDILYKELVKSLEVKRHSQILLKKLKDKLNSKYISYEILELYLMQHIRVNKVNEELIIIHNLVKYLYFTKIIWDKWTCANAAETGNLECLKYLHESGCIWDEDTCFYAAIFGNLECLKYAHENGCPWYEGTCSNAALSGNLECLKYAHENGCEWND